MRWYFLFLNAVVVVLLRIEVLDAASKCQQRTAPAATCRKPCLSDQDCITRKGRIRKCICDNDCGLSCARLSQECTELPPDEPINGFRKLGSKDVTDATIFNVNDVITYSCKTGYSIIGPSELRCSAIGKFKPWDKGRPTCRRACPNPGIPANGRRDGDLFEAGKSVTYRCNPGYTIDGAVILNCQNDLTWDDVMPKCKVVGCDKPPAIDNARIDKGSRKDYIYGDRLLYVCNAGYYRYGSSLLVCGQSGWTTVRFQCKPKSCGNPGIPSNGKREGSSFKFLQVVTFSCDNGFGLEGSAFLRCQSDQTWDGQTPTCKRVDCGEPRRLASGTYFGSSTLYGGKYSISCDNGYVPDGPSELTCQGNGRWSATTKCQVITCKSVTFDHGTVTGLIGLNSCQTIFNCKLTFACDRGYYISDAKKTLLCLQTGSWSDAPPLCIPVSCGIPHKPDHSQRIGNKFTYQGVVKYQCQQGYDLIGSDEMVCGEDGKWSKSPPTCRPKNCGSPPFLRNGSPMRPYGTKYPETIKYECNRGYQLQGSSRLSCQSNGQWSSNFQKCIEISCGKPMDIQNGYFTSTGEGYLDVVTYTCNDGYTLTRPPKQTCQDLPSVGWVGQQPACKVVNCGAQRKPSNGYVTGTSYNYNDVVKFGCHFGFVLDGIQSSARCLATGSWSVSSPDCIGVNCGRPPSISHGIIASQEGTSYRNKVTYTCDVGYAFKDAKSVTCLGVGKWSASPQCDLVQCGRPDTATFTVTKGTSFNFNDIVEVSCNDGKKLIGSPQLQCNANGKWDTSGIKCQGSCDNPLGMESGRISNRMIVASTEYHKREKDNSRLNKPIPWCGYFSNHYAFYVDIKFRYKVNVTGVAVQGGVDIFSRQRWPTRLFFWAADGVNWLQTKYYNIRHNTADDITNIVLDRMYTTDRFVAVLVDSNTGRTTTCARFELYGC